MMRVTASGLIIPSQVASVRAPKFECMVCGQARFYEDELAAYERHVAKCSEQHEDAIAAASPRSEGPFSDDAGFDVELEAWAKRHGRVK